MDDTSLNGYEPDPEFNIENATAMRAFKTLGEFLESDEWYPQRADNSYAYWVTYDSPHGDIRCYASIRVEEQQLLIYANAPVRVPEEQRAAIAEFITRANYGLVIGNFELDYADGRLRFKVSLDFEDDELGSNMVRNAIYPAARTMSRYLPGVMKVIYAAITPAAAIEQIESPPEASPSDE